MNLLKRLGIILLVATAMVSFLFLFVFSVAGVGPDELDKEDAFMLLFIWLGSIVIGIYGTCTSSDA